MASQPEDIAQPDTDKPRSGPSMPTWIGPLDIRSVALTGIFALLLLYTVYFAAPVLMPLTMALLLNLVLSPIVRVLAKCRIPAPIGAAMTVLLLLAAVIGGVYSLSAPAAKWLQEVPERAQEIEDKLQHLVQPVKAFQEATQKVEAFTQPGEAGGQSVVEVQVGQVSLINLLLSSTTEVIFGVVISLVLLFFLLASGDNFLRKLVHVIPRFADKRRAVETAHNVQNHISIFLFTITSINIMLGIAVAVAMYLIGMPNPILWGAVAGLLNYAPYLGSLVTMGLLTAVALLSFDSLVKVALVPAIILGFNLLEGQIITPIITGRRLKLSPVAIFIFLVLFGWLWGIIGTLVAVPLLAIIKLISEEIDSLHIIAEFIGE